MRLKFPNAVENIDDNNYDEDDLMEIDRRQSSALSETENDPENDPENEHPPAEGNKPASFFNT